MKKFIVCLFFLSSLSLTSQTLYWVNKNGGNFGDAANWSDVSGGSGGVASPDPTIDVVFDKNSGLEPGENVVFEPGVDYHAKSLSIDSDVGAFTLLFQGTNVNRTTLSLYGNLNIKNLAVTSFTNPGAFNNVLKFNGAGVEHFITVTGQDWNHIEFLNPNGTYVQETNLYASSQIQMYGGEWYTQGFDVVTDGLLRFQDNQTPSTQFSKEFYTDGSDIFCQEFYAKFVYGSLSVNGSHRIHTEVFDGNPSQPTVPTVYDDLILLDYEPGTLLPIEDNNLDCAGCFFQSVRVSDRFVTRIGGGLEIQNLIVENIESEIQINGGNSRESIIDLGTVSSPSVGSCNAMPSIEAIYSSAVSIEAINSSLTLTHFRLKDVNAGEVGTYILSGGILEGNSKGWNLVNPLPSNTFSWRNTNGNNLWDDWKNWDNSLGTTGCIPTEIDDVVIDNTSSDDIELPAAVKAKCKNLIWAKDDAILDMQINLGLDIYGNVTISKFATFRGTGSIDLLGVGSFKIESFSEMPRIDFRSEASSFALEAALASDQLYFSGGDFITNGFDILTNEWSVDNNDGNNFYFGNSDIDVLGGFNLASNNGVEQTVDAGTSTITCETFMSRKSYDFYNLVLQNPLTFSFENFPFTFNTLELQGAAPVRVLGDMEVNTLSLTDGDADLEIVPGVELTVNNSITSGATSGSPSSLTATSSTGQALITKPTGNLCIAGFVDIQDISASAEGIVHAPDGNNLGNNTNIDFTGINTSSSLPLYWVGKTTNWALRSNWSTISGGCSTNFNPNNRPQLIFDENSYYDNAQAIIFTSTTTNEILFTDISSSFTLDNRVGLSLQNILLDGASVELIGEDFNLTGELSVKNASLLEMRADVLRSPMVNNNSSSLIIVRNASQIIQE